jgi:small-conductance mechanosensitive channel
MEAFDVLLLFNNGFKYVIDGISSNFGTLLFVIFIGFLTVFVARSLNTFMDHYFKRLNTRVKTNTTTLRMFRHVSVAVVYIIGIVVVILNIPALHNLSVALFTGASVIGIVVGLAAQTTLSNMIAGLSLAVFQPFRVGDRLDFMNEYGKVEDLNLRHTVITTWDNRRLIIPNSKMSTEAIINWTIKDPAIIWSIDVSVTAESNIDKAREIMIEEAKRSANVMLEEPDSKERGKIQVFVVNLNLINNIIDLRLQVWFNDRGVAYNSGCEIREAIIKRFSEEGMLKKV